MSVKEYEGSLGGDENILKSDHGNDCTTFYMMKTTELYTLKD